MKVEITTVSSSEGLSVTIKATRFEEGDTEYGVYVNGARVFVDLDDQAGAIAVARWYLSDCPA